MKSLLHFFSNHLREIIESLKGPNSFVRNVAYSLSGNTIVLGIGFLLTPVIARIYGPAAYGQFAIFAAIASLIQPISTFQLPAGYVAANNHEQFSALIKISFATLLGVSLIVFLGALIYITFGPVPQFSRQLALSLPLYIFFAGLFSISRGWNIKLEEFRRSAKSKVIATLTGKSTTLGYGWLIAQSALGMIAGSIVTFIFESLGYVSKQMWNDIKLVFHTRLKPKFLKRTFHDFIEYPKYVTTNSVINNFSNQIPIYFIATWYSAEKVGLFSLALSLITIPINLFGNSIGAVFLPKISSMINDDDLRNKTLVALYKKLFYPGLFGLVLLAIALKLILPTLLGNNWVGAGQLSAFMAISFAFSVVALPISVTYRLIHFERINLALTVVFIVLKIAGLASGLWTGNFIYSIVGYFAANILHNACKVFFLFKKLRIKTSFIIRDVIVSLLIFMLTYILTY